jgi:uncharacterized protein (UPF0333 family)
MHHLLFLIVLIAIVVFAFMSWGSIESFWAAHFASHASSTANNFQSSGSASAGGVIDTLRSKLS